MASDPSRPIDVRARREPPPFRRVRVRRTESLSPRMLRIVVGGAELAGFEIPGPASSVRLLLPPPGADDLVLPTWTGNQFELPNGERAPIRTFTPRAFDPDGPELTIDVVLHDVGAATEWARSAEPGDQVAISGPGRSDDLDDAATYLLVGDESAMPAIAQLLEAIPDDRSVDAHIELTHPDAGIELPRHPGATVAWHVAASGAPPGAAMIAAVESIDDLPESVWVAGEAAAVQRLRTHLFDERRRSRSHTTVRGYWKRGRAAT